MFWIVKISYQLDTGNLLVRYSNVQWVICNCKATPSGAKASSMDLCLCVCATVAQTHKHTLPTPYKLLFYLYSIGYDTSIIIIVSSQNFRHLCMQNIFLQHPSPSRSWDWVGHSLSIRVHFTAKVLAKLFWIILK